MSCGKANPVQFKEPLNNTGVIETGAFSLLSIWCRTNHISIARIAKPAMLVVASSFIGRHLPRI
jgi:hypothetical protein